MRARSAITERRGTATSGNTCRRTRVKSRIGAHSANTELRAKNISLDTSVAGTNRSVSDVDVSCRIILPHSDFLLFRSDKGICFPPWGKFPRKHGSYPKVVDLRKIAEPAPLTLSTGSIQAEIGVTIEGWG